MDYEAIEDQAQAAFEAGYPMSPLTQAKMFWRNGYPISTDLAMTLASEGYDVEALEQKHLTY